MLAEPELEPLLEEEAALEPEPEPEPVPEPEPKEDPVYLEKRPEGVVGGTVAKPNSWPWQVKTPVSPCSSCK